MENLFRPKHFTLQWHITERCNWQCKHCYQECDKMPPDLTLDQLFHIFDQYLFLIKKWQIPPRAAALNITGGEPLVRKDFFQFMEKLSQRSHSCRLGILTNGSLFTEENLEKLKEANISKIQVSLEGMEKRNDEIRGGGAFKKTVAAIRLLVKVGIPVQVSFTLTKKNMEDVPTLVKLLDKLGVFGLGTRRLIPWGRGKELKDYMLQPRELRDYYLKVKKINKKLLQKKRRFNIVIGCESGIFNEELFADPNSSTQSNLCGVVQGRILTIMANGDILPCRRLPIVVGNALRDNIYDVYYSQQMQEFRDLNKLHPFCQKCSNFSNCFGGAKCVIYAYTGKLNIPDVQCWRAYTELDKPKF